MLETWVMCVVVVMRAAAAAAPPGVPLLPFGDRREAGAVTVIIDEPALYARPMVYGIFNPVDYQLASLYLPSI